MKYFLTLCKFVVVLGLVPTISSLGGETAKELSGNALEATTGSVGSHILEGKLLHIDGEFWVVEDMASNQHRIHIGPKTTLPQAPKQSGDSVQAVVRKNGHALLIQ
jgi:hypothetical protein